jgi:capsular polysaccharide biosynthesis protein
VELVELWRVVRKRLTMIIVIAVVAVVTAGVLSKFVLTKQYTSTATLMVIPHNSAQDLITSMVTGESLVATYAQVATSQSVLGSVVQSEHLALNELQLSHHVVATPVVNTDLVTVSATSPNPLWSSRVANAVADATVRNITRVTQQRDLEVVDPATTATIPVSPKTKTNVAIALVLGLLVGGGLAFLLEYLDDSVKTEDDVKRVLDLPVLTLVPYIDTESPAPAAKAARSRGSSRRDPRRRSASGAGRNDA